MNNRPKTKITSSKKKITQRQMIKNVKMNLARIHGGGIESHSIEVMNEIIYNEKAHIVAIFKDYLIYDDVSEFLKRQYKVEECTSRIPKICQFYDYCNANISFVTKKNVTKWFSKVIKHRKLVVRDNISIILQ